ncbi:MULTISPECIES: NAD/NADP octopine/nopaline dehydrogenase family protein [Nocardia]|uniref:NAD/NADP octopine/nopaline dehydrogenase family protein n=1 Tax=Nocardia TaxID=1817 RepID=UPI000D68EF6E|nr:MULTISPECIES: NAD/NADP octopine/nopaline dehydrogenase family protein [Nocardia]
MKNRTKVAIFGGGHVGRTLSYDLAGRADVDLFTSSPESNRSRTMRNIFTKSERHVSLDSGHREHGLDSSVFGRVVDGAEFIFVTVPDIPGLRMDIVDRILSRNLRSDVVLVFIRGGQGGMPWLYHRLSVDARPPVTAVYVEDSFYGTRVGPQFIDYKRKDSINIAVSGPGGNDVVARLQRLFGVEHKGQPWPALASKSALGLLFDPLGYIVHTATLLDPVNIARSERGECYLHYSEGIHAQLAPRLAAMDAERVDLAGQYRCRAESFVEILDRQYGHRVDGTFFEVMRATGTFYRSYAPSSLAELRASRALWEDIPALATVLRMAAHVGQRMPVTEEFAAMLPGLLETVGLDYRQFEAYPVDDSHIDVLMSGA